MSISSVVGRIYWGIFADRLAPGLPDAHPLHAGRTDSMAGQRPGPDDLLPLCLIWGFRYGGVGTQYGMVSREILEHACLGQAMQPECLCVVGMSAGGFWGLPV